jgi:hypothetical protein
MQQIKHPFLAYTSSKNFGGYLQIGSSSCPTSKNGFIPNDVAIVGKWVRELTSFSMKWNTLDPRWVLIMHNCSLKLNLSPQPVIRRRVCTQWIDRCELGCGWPIPKSLPWRERALSPSLQGGVGVGEMGSIPQRGSPHHAEKRVVTYPPKWYTFWGTDVFQSGRQSLTNREEKGFPIGQPREITGFKLISWIRTGEAFAESTYTM